MPGVLLDTGAFIALLDKSDPAHSRCEKAFRQLARPLFTTEAVLTETLHFLVDPRDRSIVFEFIFRGAVTLVPNDLRSLGEARKLMDKYKDTPMDFADATLVVLADTLGTNEVFTLDRRGFQCYRLRDKRAFKLLPE